ncbi:protocatechuate 3,4-dioxygenase subunit alpha [Paracoccus salsus]|uniref:protocatechuate 3,4-dioxygenase subunit alpha n=1 Tax=Paracoccus salsus TaxID=2911061 RepID=UPI001F40AF5F|nr:protocatechuate 3,4-dioxygenase subunit alpha [Paracoccus salsus]MCF3972220.1 protocatechuate 3,4-dioxygenase subunit alpha [Paracoccus salsus]
MPQRLTYLRESASQTAGPYVPIGLSPGAAGFDICRQEPGHDIAGPNTMGQRIRIEGLMIDGMGSPVKDVLIAMWPASARDRYAHPDGAGEVEEGIRGRCRDISDFETGEWGFDTVAPGPVPGRHGRLMAPHLDVWIVARGIKVGLNTRIHFDDEASANAADPVINRIEWERRRATLIAKRQDRDGAPVCRFDIRLHGDDETVIFDI